MANYFEQFEPSAAVPAGPAPTPTPTTGGNYFQQFDPTAVAAPAPAQQSLTAARPVTSWWREPALAGSEFLRGALGTMVGLGGTGEAESEMSQAKGLGVVPPETPLPTSNDIMEGAGRAGLIGRADLQPEGMGEHLLAGAAYGAGASLPLAAAGSPAAIVPTLVSGATSGLTTEAAKEAGPPAASALGMLAGLPAGGAVSMGERLLGGELTPQAAEFAAAGLTPRSAALTGTGLVPRLLRPAMPLEETQSDIGQGVENVAAGLGASRTPQQAGVVLQNSARNWMQNVMPMREAMAWTPVDEKIPGETAASPDNLVKTINSLKPEQKAVLGRVFGPGLDSAIRQGPERMPTLDPTLGRLQREAAGGGPLTSKGFITAVEENPDWAGLRSVRSRIGAAMRNPTISGNIGQDTLNRLYAAATEDLGTVARAHGASDEFAAANAESTRLHNFAEQQLSKIITTTGARESIAPENAAANVLSTLRKGDTTAAELRRELPHAMDELAAAHLRQTGLAEPLEPGSSVASGFPTKWQVQERLGVTPTMYGSMESRLGSLADVAQRVKRMTPQEPGRRGVNELVGLGAGGALGAVAAYLPHLVMGTAPGAGREILGGALGELGGAAAPLLWNMVREPLARSPSLAGYYGRQAPAYFPFQRTGAAALGAFGVP